MGSWPVRPGVRFFDGKLSIQVEQIQEDNNLPPDLRTARLLRNVANSIVPMIKMKGDVRSNHPSGKLPILDLEVWVTGHRIYHQFFKKSMASRTVMQARSAFSASRKQSILFEEGERRLRNCSPELRWEEKARFLNKFSSEMKYSGHTTAFRKTILRRVILKYQNDLSNHNEGKRCLYRSRKERNDMNEKKATSDKDTWEDTG